MNIAVIGTGYVGLVAGTCFAESGNEVVCVDIDKVKVASLKEGAIPFYEPGLRELVQRNIEEQRLSFSTDLKSAVRQSNVIFIAVGTPQGADGSPNINQVINTAKSIAKAMNGSKIVVNKRTVPVGTAEQVATIIK